MDFQTKIAKYSARQIMEALGCPRATANQWISGLREPPEWQWPHWLRIIEENAPEKRDGRRKK